MIFALLVYADPLVSFSVQTTGCDLVMVGRWAIGNPWIFERTETYMATGELLPEPTLRDRVEMAVRHLRFSVETKGVHYGVLEMRRHLAAYIKGLRGAAEIRRLLMTEADPEEVEMILYGLLEVDQNMEEEAA